MHVCTCTCTVTRTTFIGVSYCLPAGVLERLLSTLCGCSARLWSARSLLYKPCTQLGSTSATQSLHARLASAALQRRRHRQCPTSASHALKVARRHSATFGVYNNCLSEALRLLGLYTSSDPSKSAIVNLQYPAWAPALTSCSFPAAASGTHSSTVMLTGSAPTRNMTTTLPATWLRGQLTLNGSNSWSMTRRACRTVS